MTADHSAGKQDEPGGDESKAGSTGWVLALFFGLLLAINATFFIIALSNPPDTIPVSPTTGEPANTGASSGTGGSPDGSHR